MQNTRGFSLVELAIVILIIGVILAGISGGANLLKSANLNSVVTERNSFVSAITAFQGRYGYLPGDLPNAINVVSNASLGSGDGNGRISWVVTTGTNSVAASSFEPLVAWQQLGLGGFVGGSYTGQLDGGNLTLNNSPVSKYQNGLWIMANSNTTAMAGNIMNPNAVVVPPYTMPVLSNYLFLGGAITGSLPGAPLFTGSDAYSIDAKIDDGRGNTGLVLGRSNCTGITGFNGTSFACTTTPLCIASTGAYDISTNNANCELALYFQ